MKKRSIYHNQSQEIISLFKSAKDRTKVICVPMDYAKKDHVDMFCNGNGDILRKPFPVKNSLEGKKYLVDQVIKSCRYRGIKRKHVLFGGEDCGSYADNFIEALRSDKWLVAGVNAYDAKKYRDNQQASTDSLDLLGVCKMLLNGRGNCFPAQTGIYWNMRMLVRRRNRATLSRFLARNLVLHADQCAKQLQEYASQVLQPPKKHIAALQLALQQQVKLLGCLQESIQHLEKEIAEHLAQTSGAYLTSIRGIGIVLAAGVCSEIGDPCQQRPTRNLVSYAGIIPRIKQTGGPQGKTQVKKVGKRCNRILKDCVVRSGHLIGMIGPEELRIDYKRPSAQGQHANFGMSRRYLRMAMCLMRTSQTYLPESLRSRHCPMKERAQYYLLTWPTLRGKWKSKKALEFAFDKNKPLGQWRNVVQTLYGIELEL